MSKFKNIEKAVEAVIKDIIDFAIGSQRFAETLKIGNVVAEMQSGKTKFLQTLAQRLFDENGWKVFYTISQALTELNNQFQNDMRPYPNIECFKIRKTQNDDYYEELLKEIKETISDALNQVLILGVDESEAGILEDSVLNQFINKIGRDLPGTRVYIVTTGATPASLRHLQGNLKIGIKNFRMKPGDGYVGLKEFWEEGCIRDTSHFDEDETLQPHSEVVSALDEQLKKHESGLYIHRVKTRTKEQADHWGNFYRVKYHADILDKKTEVVVVYEDKIENIDKKLLKCEKKSFFKNVIVIVVGSLTMGYRLYEEPEHKSRLRFGYDDSGKDMSVVQGIPGRMCGYYKHDNPIIFMRISAIKEYLKVLDIENSYNDISPTASTALKGAKHIETNFTSCEIVGDYDITKHVEQNMTSKQIFDSFKSLGYSTENARYNSSDSQDFVGQWGNSEADKPNYDVISGTWKGVKPFCLLIDKNNKKVRVVKKTGDRIKVKVKHNKSNETNKSLWNSPQFSNKSEVING